MPVDLKLLAWNSAGQLAAELARYSRFPVQGSPATDQGSDVEHVCEKLGLEAEKVTLLGRTVREQLRQSAPALLPVNGAYLGIAGFRRNAAVLLAPDLSLQSMDIEALRDALCAETEAPYVADVTAMLERWDVPAKRAREVRRALLEEQIASQHIGSAWQLRVPPGSSFLLQLRAAGLVRRLLVVCGAHVGEYMLWLAAWWVLGNSALNGRIDAGLLTAWVLTLVTIVPLRILAVRSTGLLALTVGGLLKKRLLAGALRLTSEQVRDKGAGELLGRVIESEAVEALALTGGLAALMAGFELILSGIILVAGAGGLIHALLLATWVAAIGVLAMRYTRTREHWTSIRLELTNQLVENMAGHRTRIVQEVPHRWHNAEDEQLDRYFAMSEKLDRASVRLTVLAPHGWLLIGIAALAPALLTGGPTNLPATAIGLGGLLLSHQALRRMAGGLGGIASASISWKQVAELFRAASRNEASGVVTHAVASASPEVIRAQDIHFRHRDAEAPVLRGISFQISKGDWVLLEGGSGGGKSTLTSLLAGLREPQSGLLLSQGLDYRTLGARRWRRHIATAPQYHENHILTETLAFNLLLGRRWPATEKDLEEAEAVCRELGLGELLERMPAGIQQVVGETGWQLSQGERTRVFMARALLQESNLVILDESFAALDPENVRQCLECVLRRSETLMVVAQL